MFLDLGSSFSTFKRDEHQSCDLKWRSSNGKVGNFTQTQQGQGEVLLVGGAFCHWFETYVQVKLKYLTRYGQRETLTPPPISSQETSTPKKVLWLDTCEKKNNVAFWDEQQTSNFMFISWVYYPRKIRVQQNSINLVGYQSIDGTTTQFFLQ